MASDDDPMPPPPPYWPALVINGVSIDRSHLDPMPLHCACDDRTFAINVTYSPHCFARSFREGIDDEAALVLYREERRAFCPERYRLSKDLPAMIKSLPDSKVWQTRKLRNFGFCIALKDGKNTYYPAFFSLKPDNVRQGDLAMVVESAYPMPATQIASQMREAPKVKFKTLCQKIAEGKPLRFRER